MTPLFFSIFHFETMKEKIRVSRQGEKTVVRLEASEKIGATGIRKQTLTTDRRASHKYMHSSASSYEQV
jgi:hypothetical protein